MNNITVKIDEATYRKARLYAAEQETSVSALVRDFLQNQLVDKQAHESRVQELEAVYGRAQERAQDRPAVTKALSREEANRRS